MAVFVSFALLSMGAYLIRDQFENPVTAHPGALLIAAVLIATALVLLSYLIYPGRPHESAADIMDFAEERPSGRTIDISVRPSLTVRREHSDLPADHRYVDTARIRP
jgi:hypothetical protein